MLERQTLGPRSLDRWRWSCLSSRSPNSSSAGSRASIRPKKSRSRRPWATKIISKAPSQSWPKFAQQMRARARVPRGVVTQSTSAAVFGQPPPVCGLTASRGAVDTIATAADPHRAVRHSGARPEARRRKCHSWRRTSRFCAFLARCCASSSRWRAESSRRPARRIAVR